MRARSLVFLALVAGRALSQAPAGASVTGVVRDSIARAPLSAAVVQLAAADSLGRFARSTVSDSLGRFAFADVPNGRYTLGFLHPMLDSLGLEPLLREVNVSGQREVRVDLAVPSAARLRAAICGSPVADSGALVVGFVRSAQDRAPASGVPVTAEWLEFAFTPQGVVRRTPHVTVMTHENGWFALCNMPGEGTMFLFAGSGADSTGRIEVQIPKDGFARRELHLGSTQSVVRLSGAVVTAVGRRPIEGALVSIAGGGETHTDARGEWTLVDMPAGTRMLEVRAVGYYPERRSIEVMAGATPLRSVLPTLKSVLDTVNISASRLDDRNMRDFEARRRGSGVGHFLTAEDIARRNPFQTSDLFRMVPGMSQYLDSVQMRSAVGQEACSPTLYINGAPVNSGAQGLLTDDIDIWARPNEIAGIEIYTHAPPQFQRALSGCGSIVIWTKPPPRTAASRSSWTYRILQAVVIGGVLIGIGMLVDYRKE